jgi:hypothetical protein
LKVFVHLVEILDQDMLKGMINPPQVLYFVFKYKLNTDKPNALVDGLLASTIKAVISLKCQNDEYYSLIRIFFKETTALAKSKWCICRFIRDLLSVNNFPSQVGNFTQLSGYIEDINPINIRSRDSHMDVLNLILEIISLFAKIDNTIYLNVEFLHQYFLIASNSLSILPRHSKHLENLIRILLESYRPGSERMAYLLMAILDSGHVSEYRAVFNNLLENIDMQVLSSCESVMLDTLNTPDRFDLLLKYYKKRDIEIPTIAYPHLINVIKSGIYEVNVVVPVARKANIAKWKDELESHVRDLISRNNLSIQQFQSLEIMSHLDLECFPALISSCNLMRLKSPENINVVKQHLILLRTFQNCKSEIAGDLDWFVDNIFHVHDSLEIWDISNNESFAQDVLGVTFDLCVGLPLFEKSLISAANKPVIREALLKNWDKLDESYKMEVSHEM